MDERKRLNREDYDATIDLSAVYSVLMSNRLERVTRRAKYGYRDLQLVRKKLEYLTRDIALTVPIEQLKRLSAHVKGVYIKIVTRNSALPGDEGYFLTDDDVLELVNKATKDCIFCDGDRHSCKLRKVLRELPLESDVVPGVGCVRKGREDDD